MCSRQPSGSKEDAHRVKLTFDGGGRFYIELLHAGACDQSRNHDGECVLEDWVENVGDEILHGEITLPVSVEWAEEDSPKLTIVPAALPAAVPSEPDSDHWRGIAKENREEARKAWERCHEAEAELEQLRAKSKGDIDRIHDLDAGLAPAIRNQERQRIQEALAAKVKEAEKRVAGERPEDRYERLKELLGSDWPVVTLMRNAGAKLSPPWVWWMEDNGYDHDKYEVEHYVPLAALDTLDPSGDCEQCGGSKGLTEVRRAPVSEAKYRADLGPCPKCNPSGEQGTGRLARQVDRASAAVRQRPSYPASGEQGRRRSPMAEAAIFAVALAIWLVWGWGEGWRSW